MNVLCLCVDRLHRNFVGAYGNTWIHTPALDRFAFESAVFDQFLVETPEPAAVLQAAWTGLHPLQSRSSDASLILALNDAGFDTLLVTDSWDLLPVELASQFRRRILTDVPLPERPVDEIGQTYLAGVFAQCVAVLETATEPFCAWVVLRGLGGPWDAPIDLRAHYADEGDPPPYEAILPPNLPFRKEDDPDILLAILQAYAAQATVLDSCLEAFREWFINWPGRDRTAILFLSLRGFPLGEHGWIGADAPQIFSEVIHTPLIVRLPERVPAALRIPALVEPADLCPTVAELAELAGQPSFGIGRSLLPLITEQTAELRNRIVLTETNGVRALRTGYWFFRDTDPPELYIKPDDFWDFSNVADRCADVAEAMRKTIAADIEALREGRWEDFAVLDECVTTRPE
ncbi:MAG: sulfatase-like hydrolase/transferase [Thermoguttaceae bacterium]|nr:sulfatase-like hydrolase/transferase [Thermoguttaceae bacterium]